MRPVPLVRASSLRPLFDFLDRAGGDLQGVRDRAGPVFREPEVLLPIGYAGALFDEAARASGLADLGMRLAAATSVDGFGRWGALILRSPTAGAFLQRALASYRAFDSSYHAWTVTRGEETWLHVAYCRSLRRGRAQVSEFSLLLWLAGLHRILGPGWRPAELHFEADEPPHAAALDALAIRGARFRQPALAIAVPRRDLARRHETVCNGAPFDLGGPIPASDFTGSLRQTAETLLRFGRLELAAAAEAAGMSERSLQRRLGEAGLTFSDIVEGARFAVARRMLADPAVRVADVSAELGYTDSANFTRAFRRWSGVPPRVFRGASAASKPAR